MEPGFITNTNSNTPTMMAHPLHETVADTISDIAAPLGLRVFRDEACVKRPAAGPLQHLPFFLSMNPHNDTEISNVDLMVVKDGKVKLICEIEESDISPVRTYGKIFTVATAVMCRLANKTQFSPDDQGVFVQILSNKALNELSDKEAQGRNIEEAINNLLRAGGSWIKRYHLIYGEVGDFGIEGDGYAEIRRILKGL